MPPRPDRSHRPGDGPDPGGRPGRPRRPARPRLAVELWRDGTALVLYARAYARFAARRRAGLACELCAHEGARAVTGDRRLAAGPHAGTCALGCYAHLEALDYRAFAHNPEELRRGPPLHPATVEAVCRRLLARAAAHDGAPPAGPAGAQRIDGRAARAGGRTPTRARRGAPQEVC